MRVSSEQAGDAPLEPLTPALEVRDLDFSYGGKGVLESVSLAIEAGEFVVLLGPNGAGKTTLFSLITRLHDRRRGEIRIGGFDVRGQAVQAHARIGVVFQQPTLDLDLSVVQNLAYHGALHGMGPREARRQAELQLERVGLSDQHRTRVRRLSGGQRRRVEIARGLMHSPRLLLLDEPTVGLDIASRRELVEHAHRLCVEEGVAVLWATHLIDEVRPGDRVLVLHRGRLLADGNAETLTTRLGVATLGEAFDRLVGAGEAACD